MATAVRKVNWFAIWVSVAVVVVVIAVGGVVVVMNNATADSGATPSGSSINSETGAIAVGKGSNTLDTYVDFMCPVCNQFEKAYGPTIQKQVDGDALTLNIHAISILDRASSGTDFSSRSASAMYCVAEGAPDKAADFMRAMFAKQPPENSSGLTDDEIVKIANSVGVTDAGIEKCITSHKFVGFVQALTKKTPIQPGQQGISTPTLVINGTTLANQKDLTGDPQADIVDRFKK